MSRMAGLSPKVESDQFIGQQAISFFFAFMNESFFFFVNAVVGPLTLKVVKKRIPWGEQTDLHPPLKSLIDELRKRETKKPKK